jgi:hypothetical protein
MDVVTETVAEVVGSSCKLAACTTDRGPTTFAVSSITAQEHREHFYSSQRGFSWLSHFTLTTNGEGVHA